MSEMWTSHYFDDLTQDMMTSNDMSLIPFPECLQGRMADSGSGDSSGQRAPTPGGSNAGLLTGRRPTAISQGRLPSMRSRDLTLGGVKKVMCACVCVAMLQRVVENDIFIYKTNFSIIPQPQHE